MSSVELFLFVICSRNVHSNGSMYCSTSTLSDTGSWDTDFDDDQNSESSGFYGDVAPTVANIEKPAPEVQTKSSGVGRVAALAKTVAASLAASGHAGMTNKMFSSLLVGLGIFHRSNYFQVHQSSKNPLRKMSHPIQVLWILQSDQFKEFQNAPSLSLQPNHFQFKQYLLLFR